MAYRKTETAIAEIEGRRAKIVATAMDIIAKQGADALTAAAIADCAKLSVGLIFRHFPDMAELRSFVYAQFLARDLAVIREAGTLEKGIRAWATQLAENPRLTAALATQVSYRDGIRRELTKMIKATGCESPAILASIVVGAVIETAGSLARFEPTLTTTLLKAMGIRARASA